MKPQESHAAQGSREGEPDGGEERIADLVLVRVCPSPPSTGPGAQDHPATAHASGATSEMMLRQIAQSGVKGRQT